MNLSNILEYYSLCDENNSESLSEDEKKSLSILKKNVECLKSAGAARNLSPFILSCRGNKRKRCFKEEDDPKENKFLNEEIFKNVTFKLFGESTSSNTKSLDEDITPENLSNSRYPKRSIKKKSYKEEDVCSDDEFLQCDLCEREYKGPCPIHGPMLWVCDRKTPEDDPDKATNSLPVFLSISQSAIPKAGLGVWTEVPLPPGFVFGPYKGRVIRNPSEAQKSGYAWQVWKGKRPHHYVEAEDKRDSNWLRYVNSAVREDQQNLLAFQYKQEVYYRTYKAVQPFTELMVWYGNEYADDMGIDMSEDTTPPRNFEGDKCDICGALFTIPEVLERHRRGHPHLIPDKKHRCPTCSYSSDKMSNFTAHLLTHSGEKPHRCAHCGKGFAKKDNLLRHVYIHTGERPYACGTCDMTFNQPASLRKHERAHSGERPFRCKTCGKDFSQAVNLSKHERIHTLQKPYRCPHCSFRSAISSALTAHVVSMHTRDFRHKCTQCGVGYHAPSRLAQHVEKHHPLSNEVKAEVKEE